MAAVRLQSLTKLFGGKPAVRELSLHIADGEFFSILGPSGCGKTTTLRMIAGFETPDTGTIHFDNQDVTTLPANRRNTGMVFQNYALFPHMTVGENVAFGLRARKMPKAEMAARIQQNLAMLAMEDFFDRPVTQLSGGQQQRVALARALAVQPDILLLDEPLSNLDAQLRRSTRHELKSLQRRLGITTIYVTHDQEEAMALSDRLLVMNQGRTQQIGAPEEIYFSPANLFVMDFIGRSNVLTGCVAERSENAMGLEGDGWKIFSDNFDKQADWQIGAPAQIAFRPQDVVLHQVSEGTNEIAGRLRFIEFRGDFWEAELVIGDRPCLIHLTSDEARVLRSRLAASDDRLWLHVPPAKVFVFAG